MKEYEISQNNKYIGKIKLFKNNFINNIEKSLIKSNKGNTYETLKKHNYQTYELSFKINDVDELYDIVSKYESGDIFEKIEDIKEYNNIKSIKKDTIINVIVPEIYLKNLNVYKKDIDLTSLFLSKIHFIKKVLENNNLYEVKNNLNVIITDYNNYIKANEYEFLTDDEKKENIELFIDKINKLILDIESKTTYKYGKDYIVPIKINN